MRSAIDRRRFIGITLASLLPALAGGNARRTTAANAPTLGPPRPFSFASLIGRAQALAGSRYRPPRRPAPDVVRSLDYEALGKIRFRRERALFGAGGGAYPITFFHLGKLFPEPVGMFALERGEASEILYSPSYFEYPQDGIADRLPADAGFAGFRIHEARSRADWKTQDWVAFLGASYFRAIGALGQYGLSARGVAVDTATDVAEDFPSFIEFYIAPAAREGDPVVIHALMDGARVSGAYRFAIQRTAGVVMDVEARLFLRRDVRRLGIAPLTSMFWFAEYNRRHGIDWRPEVHDSDGLAIWTGGGERLWRPLGNPPSTGVSSFLDDGPRGFGLLQRDRRVENYLDGVNYHLRPSLWVEPLDDWGPGAVQLVEIPTDDEIHDNVVAFWVPREPGPAGASYTYRYRLHWLADEPYPAETLAKTVATRLGRGGEPGKARPEGAWKFVVEFAGGPLERLAPDAAVTPVVTTSQGTVGLAFAEPVPETRRWRAQFDIAPDGVDSLELRLYLRSGDRALTETWLYRHAPRPQG